MAKESTKLSSKVVEAVGIPVGVVKWVEIRKNTDGKKHFAG